MSTFKQLMSSFGSDGSIHRDAAAAFNEVDTNSSGKIDTAELTTAVRAVSKKAWPQARIDFMMKKFDADSDGELNLAEFEALLTYSERGAPVQAELQEAWELVDNLQEALSFQGSLQAAAGTEISHFSSEAPQAGPISYAAARVMLPEPCAAGEELQPSETPWVGGRVHLGWIDMCFWLLLPLTKLPFCVPRKDDPRPTLASAAADVRRPAAAPPPTSRDARAARALLLPRALWCVALLLTRVRAGGVRWRRCAPTWAPSPPLRPRWPSGSTAWLGWWWAATRAARTSACTLPTSHLGTSSATSSTSFTTATSSTSTRYAVGGAPARDAEASYVAALLPQLGFRSEGGRGREWDGAKRRYTWGWVLERPGCATPLRVSLTQYATAADVAVEARAPRAPPVLAPPARHSPPAPRLSSLPPRAHVCFWLMAVSPQAAAEELWLQETQAAVPNLLRCALVSCPPESAAAVEATLAQALDRAAAKPAFRPRASSKV
jgi:hypothetical protein